VIIAGNWKMFRGPDPVALRERIAGIEARHRIQHERHVHHIARHGSAH